MNNIYSLSNIDIEKWKKKSNQIIIPIGSLEQHGPHLPVATDTIIIEHLAKTIAEKIQCLYIPDITFGIYYLTLLSPILLEIFVYHLQSME